MPLAHRPPPGAPVPRAPLWVLATALVASLAAPLAVACVDASHQAPAVAPPPVSAAVVAAEQVAALGQDPETRGHRAAAAWLLQHPRVSHPLLVSLLERRGPGWRAVPRLLAQMGQPEGVAALERALHSDDLGLRWDSAVALGTHPSASAGRALEQALTSADDAIVRAGLRGLEARKDPATCAAVVGALPHDNPGVRYHALDVSIDLACVFEDGLQALLTDPDAGVRGLVTRALVHPLAAARASSIRSTSASGGR